MSPAKNFVNLVEVISGFLRRGALAFAFATALVFLARFLPLLSSFVFSSAFSATVFVLIIMFSCCSLFYAADLISSSALSFLNTN